MWESEGANCFQTGVIREGLQLQLFPFPDKYEEGNNLSFHEEQEFGLEAIRKLVEGHMLHEVDRSQLHCVNPLTVAHCKGKKRMCIDLSRCVNLLNKCKRFRIESSRQFAEIVQQGYYMWNFDMWVLYLWILYMWVCYMWVLYVWVLYV